MRATWPHAHVTCYDHLYGTVTSAISGQQRGVMECAGHTRGRWGCMERWTGEYRPCLRTSNCLQLSYLLQMPTECCNRLLSSRFATRLGNSDRYISWYSSVTSNRIWVRIPYRSEFIIGRNKTYAAETSFLNQKTLSWRSRGWRLQ
jgi:hypothetical protein